MSEQNQEIILNKNLERLTKNIEKQNSFKRSLFMGMLQGVGNVIGATIIAGILLIVLSKFIHSAEQIPLLGIFIKTSNIEASIDAKAIKK